MQLKHFVLTALALAATTPAFAGPGGTHPTPTPAAAHAAPAPHPAPAAKTATAPKTAAAPHPGPAAVPAKIAANPALAARVQPLLPSGMTLEAAASGFRNQGQFIAALHVSRNLGIPFTQLKAEMTGADHDSLGQAIHELKPSANVRTAVKTADQEADADVKATKPAAAARTGSDKTRDTH